MPEAEEDPADAPRSARPSRDPSDALHDDDELAAVLREQLERFATGAVPIIRPSSDEPDSAASAPPETPPADVPSPRSVPARPAWPSFAQADRSAGGSSPAEESEEADPRAHEGGNSPPLAAGVETESKAGGGSAAPTPPEGEGDALELLEQLQPQLSRITLDPQTFAEWERSLLAISESAPPVDAPVVPRGVAEPRAGESAGDAGGESVPNEAAAEGHPEAVVEEMGPALEPRAVTEQSLPEAAPRSAQHEVASEFAPLPASDEIEGDREEEPVPDEVPGPRRSSFEAGPGAAVPAVIPMYPVDLPVPPVAPPTPPTAETLLPSLPDPTEPVQLSGALPAHPVEEDHADEVIEAELLDEDEPGEDGDAEPSPEATTGAVQLNADPLAATDAAALTPRVAPVAGDEELPGESEEVEPLDVDAITTDTGPIRTGSVPLVAVLDRDLDDDVDDIAPPEELLPVTGSIPLTPAAETGPIAPVPSTSVRTGTISLPVAESGPPSAFTVEEADLRPVEEEQRLRRPVAQFWLWLAPNSSALTLVLGASLVALGISVRQAVVAAVLGVAVACLPLVVNVLAVKRAAQPVAVASRATFGNRGNVAPTALLLLVRLLWAAGLAWLAAGTVRAVLAFAQWDALVSPTVAGVAFAVVFPVVASLIAVFGHGLLARVHLVLGAVSVVLLLLLLGLTAPLLDGGALLAVPDGSPLRMVGAAVAVASLLSVAWAAAGGELARYQQPGASGAATAVWASHGAAVPALGLTVWGVLVDVSVESGRSGAEPGDPVGSLLEVLPPWAPIPILVVAVLGLVAALATVLYSTGLTAGALGIPGNRAVRTAPAGVIAIAAAIPLVLTDPPLAVVLGDLLPVLAVPVLAWTGIMGVELLLRPRAFDSAALLRRGAGPGVRWSALIALVVITLVGVGLVGRAQYAPFAGYLWTAFGVPADSALAQADFGVILALVAGALTAVFLSRSPSGSPEGASS